MNEKNIFITSMQIFTNMHVDNVQMLHDVNGNISEIRNNCSDNHLKNY